MDLYGIDPLLNKGYPSRSHFNRNQSPRSGSSNKFVNNDILSSSAWSSVIHQPSQDSEPEDLPSTVDINAIKEPSTPVIVSAQTPLGHVCGDCIEVEPNIGESGSDSESESDSNNSDNELENVGSVDSGSGSDSYSGSSHQSSCSSRGKQISVPSSCSNSPTGTSDHPHKFFELPKNCNLSEDSDDGEDFLSIPRNEVRDTDQLMQKPFHNPDHLEVIDEDDLAAVFSNAKQTGRELDVSDHSSNERNLKTAAETKKLLSVFSDSSNDSDMLPKQVVRDAINSIHIEPRSPPCSSPSIRTKYQALEDLSYQKGHVPLVKDTKKTWKVLPSLGNSIERRVPENLCNPCDIFLAQKKRGPGRPRKRTNGINNEKKRKNSKTKNLFTATVYPAKVLPTLQTQDDWSRRHKKGKKKNAREKVLNPEFALAIESLSEFFNQKCVIEDKKLLIDFSPQHQSSSIRSKLNQRSREKNKKRKHSDKESELELVVAVPHASTNETKTKRRYKKSSTEAPEVHQTNCDQRLPLKKRHYHAMAPSTNFNSGHQTPSNSKTRVEKHIDNTDEECYKIGYEQSFAQPNDFPTLPPTLSSMKKEKPRKRTRDEDIDTPPVLDDYSKQPNSFVGSAFSSKPAPTASPSSKKPELITPLPTETSSNVNSLNLKPPAGIFEPTRKLPASISKCKKTSIDDMLCKLKEKLKGLESPSKNTSALIRKIGENVSDDNYNIPFKRILRSKRTNSEKEKENVNTKKTKILKDVTICLLKLPIENSTSMNEPEQMKPKILKKRKIRNRTGFPMLKKKKKKKIQNTSILNDKLNPDCPDIFQTIDVALGVESKVGELCSHTKEIKVKNENTKMEPLEISEAEKLNIEEKLGILVRDRDKLLNRRSQRSQGKEKENTQEKQEEEEEEQKKGKVGNIEKPSGRLLRKRTSSKNLTKQCKLNKSENKSKLKQASKIGAKRIFPTDDSTSSFIARILRKRGKSNAESPNQASTIGNEKKSNKNVNSTMEKMEEVKSKEELDKSVMSDDSKKNDVSKKDIAPKKKRKYIPAGIFSDYFKEDRTTSADLKNRFIQFKPEDHPYGLLPPPPYFEGYLRRRQRDFKLPYDLWWLETYDKLPGRDIVESWKYKRIRLNVYYDVKPPHGYETQACNCKMPEEKDKLGCGDDCINRVLYAECSPELCPLKERCSNQRIQKHNGDMKLVKFMTKDKGIGVKTQKLIKAGEYIVEYVGEVVTDKEFKNRMNSSYKNDIHHYCLNLEGGLLIDGHRMGSDARFVNHSCEPNCEIQKWSVNGRFRMGLFAQRDIKPGEELTYDYNFSLFNPEEGQPCRCESKMCRGVIGGKSQRVSTVNAATGNVDTSSSTNVSQGASNCTAGKNSRIRPRKQERRKSKSNITIRISSRGDSDSSNKVLPRRNTLQSLAIESLTLDEKKIIQTHRVLLMRNLAQVQRVREKIKLLSEECNGNNQCAAKNNKPRRAIEFSRHLNALSQQRFIKTRGLAQMEDDPEMSKTVQLANLFRTIYTFAVSAKDEESDKTFSSFFMSLPSKQKLPMYYQQIEEPIDLTMVEKNILSGVYKDVESFDKDLSALIANNVKYYGRTSEQGIAAVRLRKAYHIAKLDHLAQIEEITGQPIPSSFRPVQENPGDEEEDVIRCICGLYNDEGTMIQCERCLVWQHIGCVKANSDAEHYHCERCSSKDVDYEIPLDVPPPEVPSPDEKHYLTLMRDELQIRQGDTVYVLRDIRDPKTNTRYTYKTVETFKYEDCDILRVEQLWKTKSGEKCAFGHHYLRPCETFHEPTRKFFPNELLKRSVYETVPLDLIMGRCYVLDLRTYCRGRPIDADPEHIYICEYSVNKEMNTFYKMKSKQPCPISTKSYAFETYNPRLRPTRTYTPHVTPASENVNTNCVPVKTISETNPIKTRTSKPKNMTEPHRNIINPIMKNSLDEDDLPLARMKNANVDGKKLHLNNISLKLLARKPCKCPLDVSYLLEMGKRNRTGKKSTQ